MTTRRAFLRAGCAAAPMLVTGVTASAALAKRPAAPVDLRFLEAGLNVVRRSAWAQADPLPWRLRPNLFLSRLTVHHTGGTIDRRTSLAHVRAAMRNILTEHRHRNYGDIGYHFVVDYAGRVWEGRSLAYEGAHTAGQNANNIGIALLGNFEDQDPSHNQLLSLGKLVRALRDEYRIKRHRVYAHRDLGQTSCPGDLLYAHISRLRDDAVA